MYSDAEIEAAVKAGILTATTAREFRDFVARSHASPGADEEHFRLLSGFNDIFVTIAAVLLLIAVGWLGAQAAPAIGAALVAASAWGLAEYFTRRRRMALPSILLLLAFTGGVLGCAEILLMPAQVEWRAMNAADGAWTPLLRLAAGAAVAGIAAFLHWKRFMVPATVAAGAAAAAATILLMLASAFPHDSVLLRLAGLGAGLAMFALAMWWDASDRQRTTRRADVAFWLHLAAAPLIVHPAFSMLGLLGVGPAHLSGAVIAILLYGVLALVALAVDRRALLVSALVYVLYAISALLRGSGSVTLGLALAALVIGAGLLLLSALWQRARRETMRLLPPAMRRVVPPV